MTIIKSATGFAFAAACLTAIATLATANAQPAYGTNPGGNSVGVPGPNPGGPGLTPYTGGSTAYYGQYAPPPGTYRTAPGTYGATQPYPNDQTAPSSAGTTEMLTNGPQGSPPPNWSAAQNVRESERYDRLLESNRAFRDARERKECGPITDPQLHQQCLASFAQYEPNAGSTPYYGSSTSNRYRSSSGR